MLSGVEIQKNLSDVPGNIRWVTNLVTSFILQVENSIPSPPIENKSMEEFGIRVPLDQQINSVFGSLKIHHKFQKVIIL